MVDRRFDAIARNLASGTSRRALLGGLLGLGGLAVGGLNLHHAGAARRGFSGPRFPPRDCSGDVCEPATQCSSDYDCGGDIVCCVGDCCKPGQSCMTPQDGPSYCA